MYGRPDCLAGEPTGRLGFLFPVCPSVPRLPGFSYLSTARPRIIRLIGRVSRVVVVTACNTLLLYTKRCPTWTSLPGLPAVMSGKPLVLQPGRSSCTLLFLRRRAGGQAQGNQSNNARPRVALKAMRTVINVTRSSSGSNTVLK